MSNRPEEQPDSCEQFRTVMKPNGNYKTERCYSYVVLLTARGKDDFGVMAVRMDYCANKEEAAKKFKQESYAPDWNVKGIWRLYDEDFEDKPEKPVPDSLAAYMNPPEGGEKR